MSILLSLVGLAVENGKRSFDLPADTAEKSLKRFATQAGLQVIFASAHTEGVRTNAVKGEWLPFEAIDQLLEGTPLRATHDKKTGIVSVARVSPGPAENAAKKKTT